MFKKPIGEAVLPIREIMPPKEKISFRNPNLEKLFNLSALDSLSAWGTLTPEKLQELVGVEVALSEQSEGEVKSRLITRMVMVERGLGAIKGSYLVAVESVLMRLRILRKHLE
jgi:hypothetical protein